jgi:hypothetical protein
MLTYLQSVTYDKCHSPNTNPILKFIEIFLFIPFFGNYICITNYYYYDTQN